MGDGKKVLGTSPDNPIQVRIEDKNIICCQKCGKTRFILTAQVVAFDSPIIGAGEIVQALPGSEVTCCVYCLEPIAKLKNGRFNTMGEISRFQKRDGNN